MAKLSQKDGLLLDSDTFGYSIIPHDEMGYFFVMARHDFHYFLLRSVPNI